MEMNAEAKSKSFLLAYFSGTGCTKEVCNLFEERLMKMGADCVKADMAAHQHVDLETFDMLVVFSPVYAFRLSSLAEKWVKALPPSHNHSPKFAVIISVSGSGEISPNTACRSYCKRVLKKKGYDLLYEKMLVMPSNFATTAEESLNLELLRVLPHKVKKLSLIS